MRIVYSLLVFLVTHTLLIQHAHAKESPGEDFTIVLRGKAKAVIVIPQNSTPREEFAARELQKYITMISGGILPVQPDSENLYTNRILIGGPERNRKTAEVIDQQMFDATVPGPEGNMVKTFGNNTLVLAGSSKAPLEYERGTLYAVYEFLEAVIGCSFVAYGNPGTGIGEYIPSRKTIRLENLELIKKKADLPYRTAIVQYFKDIPHDHILSTSFIDWLAKNRYNRINTMASVYESFKNNGLLEEAQKRGILFTVGHHESSLLFLPPDGNRYFPEHYYTTHPEYYRLQEDGSRFYPKTIWRGQWMFDSRNENAIHQTAENIKTWISKNPYVDIICLWPLDNRDSQCVCSECKKYSKIENYAYFVNEVSKKVNASYPNSHLDLLVYTDLWTYPENMNLHPSLLIEQANITRTYGKKDGTSFLGTPFEKNARAWRSSGASLAYYEYYMSVFSRNQVYFPMADELQAIYNNFKKDDYALGTGTQIECHNIWNFIFNFYVHGRTSYDTRLTIHENLERFSRIFGSGAPHIKSYIQYVEGFYEDQGDRYPGKWFIQNVDKAKVYDYFEKAYQAEPEGSLRNNIRMLRMAFRYSDLFIQGAGDGEMKYLYDRFDSYSHNGGHGIAIRSKGAGSYTPDKWYHFYDGRK